MKERDIRSQVGSDGFLPAQRLVGRGADDIRHIAGKGGNTGARGMIRNGPELRSIFH